MQHNAVSITQANDVSAGEASEIASARSALSVASELATASSNSVAETATSCRVGACDKPLRGGVRIREDTYGEECTAGFIARSVYDNKPYVMTAGHCIEVTGGVGATWEAKYHEPGESEANSNSKTFNLETIGPAHSYVFGPEHKGLSTTSKGDMGLIAISSTGFWASPLEPIVIAYGNSGVLPRNERYKIIGTEYSPKEPRRVMIACAGGVTAETEPPTSGEDCGAMIGLRRIVMETLPGGEEIEVHNLSAFDTCAAFRTSHLYGGSSGAPVYKNGRAIGIATAKMGNCITEYEGINTAERVLHVNVMQG